MQLTRVYAFPFLATWPTSHFTPRRDLSVAAPGLALTTVLGGQGGTNGCSPAAFTTVPGGSRDDSGHWPVPSKATA